MEMKQTFKNQNNEKKFERPLATIIMFEQEDIITTSGLGETYGANGDEWIDTLL